MNIFLSFPKRYLLLGLLFMVLWQGCKKEEAPTPTPEPTPTTPKTDAPTEFVMKTDGLPEGVIVDVPNKTITVLPSISVEEVKALFEQGKATDSDGEASIKSVKIEGSTITIILQGKNGKTGKIDTTQLEWKLVVSDIVASFPEKIEPTTPIKAGNNTFVTELLAMPISLNDGTQPTPSITINGQEVVAGYTFTRPDTYTIVLTVTDSKGTQHTQSYELMVQKKDIVTHDISTYTKEYKKVFETIDPARQDRWQIEGVAHRMGLGPFTQITNKVLKPSRKTVAFFNKKEGHHHIEAISKEIINNNNEITYIGVIPTQDDSDPMVSKELSKTISNFNFTILEDNNWDNYTQWTYANNSQYSYVFSGELKVFWDSPEIQSNLGNGIVNFPVIYNDEDNLLYTDTNSDKYWPNSKENVLINQEESIILGGLALGGTSYATEGNAAIGAVIVNYCQRMGITMNKAKLNDLLKNHPERLQPVYYAYYPDGVRKTWKNMKWTTRVVAYLLDLKSLVAHTGTFDLNPELKNLSQTQNKIPLFKHFEKLNYEYIKIGEEKGIIWESGIPYVSWELMQQQGLAVNDLIYNIIIADTDTTTDYLYKLDNWGVK